MQPMNDYFPDNFVDYDDPPVDSSLSSDNKDFSLTSPNSDSTGLFPLSSFSPQVQTTFPLADSLNFDLMNYYNQQQEQQEVPVQAEIPEPSKKTTRSKKAKAPAAVATPAYTENSSGDSPSEGKILDKSKRIQKREIAKERTKQKTDLATMFQGVDLKFLPEGYDDPNLDERTKKKMIQMVRNRISAQNSRDRKKGYMSQLEEQTAQLEADLAQVREERDALARELQSAQEEIQFLRNGGAGGCQNCQNQVKDEDFLVTNNGENNELDNIPAGGFSGLSSPRLVRFASSKTSLFGLFAFTALVAMIAFVNVGEQNMGVMQGNGLTQMSHARILDVQKSSPITAESIFKTKPNYVNVDLPDYSKSLMLRNINQIMHQFEKSYEPTFKAHLQKSNISIHDNLEPVVKVVKEEVKNGIVEYGVSKSKLRKNIPTVANHPPALNSMVNGDAVTSTLFCSSGQEFYDNGNQNVHVPGENNITRNASLDLEKAQYLQLLVPKGTIMRHNVNNKLTDIYGQDIYTEDQSDDTMLEIWCKVFLVRELGTSY